MKERVLETIHGSADALLQMSDPLAEQIAVASDILAQGLLRGGRVFTWGSGLCASLAQTCSFLLHTGQQRQRPPFPAICLATDTGLLSRHRDTSALTDQLSALSQPGDILITFCIGDNPLHLADAIEAAHQRDIVVIAFCCPGDDSILNVLGGSDCAVTPFTASPLVATHTLVLAVTTLCDTVEQQLFGVDS